MQSAAAAYRLLGDEARLRLLRVLSRERLNVSELTAVLGLAQSGVSRHLKLLKDAGFVDEQRAGGFTYYTVADTARIGGPLWEALTSEFDRAGDDPAVKADSARLQEVLRLRKENFVDHTGDEGTRQIVPGRSWAAWARALGLLLPPWRVADLGCGDGYLTIECCRWASSVVAIDRSDAVLERARALGARRGATNVVWKRGDLEQLPIKSASVDLALLSQTLHHVADPARALAEAARIVLPGGQVLVLELRQHDETWVRDRLGDRTLGFTETGLRRLLRAAGFTRIRTAVGARKTGDPFVVLLAIGRKATTPRRTSRRAKAA